ncbi:MAG: hypothetical protein WDO19_22535 [Bacteroidota bacterium]
MKLPVEISSKLNWIRSAAYFFKKHFIVVFGLGLIAAFGRTIQLGAFGPITSWLNISLEIIIESARIAIFLYVLGLANIKKGLLRIRHLFTDKVNLKQNLVVAGNKVKKQWSAILLNIVVFSVIAWTINYIIELLAYQTCLYITLKQGGVLSESSSEWVVLLFFKNISVIPFTLIFNALFALWITNKLKNLMPAKLQVK